MSILGILCRDGVINVPFIAVPRFNLKFKGSTFRVFIHMATVWQAAHVVIINHPRMVLSLYHITPWSIWTKKCISVSRWRLYLQCPSCDLSPSYFIQFPLYFIGQPETSKLIISTPTILIYTYTSGYDGNVPKLK